MNTNKRRFGKERGHVAEQPQREMSEWRVNKQTVPVSRDALRLVEDDTAALREFAFYPRPSGFIRGFKFSCNSTQ